MAAPGRLRSRVSALLRQGPRRLPVLRNFQVRELEGGLVDVVEVDTPAVLTIQTGINEPRYATLRAIKQAEEKEIEVRQPGEVGAAAYRVRRMFVPPKGEGAEMLNGGAEQVAQRIKEIVQERLK